MKLLYTLSWMTKILFNFCIWSDRRFEVYPAQIVQTKLPFIKRRFIGFFFLCVGGFSGVSGCDRVKVMVELPSDEVEESSESDSVDGTEINETEACYPQAILCDTAEPSDTLAICYFSKEEINVDGSFDEWPDLRDWLVVGPDNVEDGKPAANDENDASFMFSCRIDINNNIYFGFVVRDEKLVYNENLDEPFPRMHNEDSLEIYLDQCRIKHGPTDQYNGDDIHMLIPAKNFLYESKSLFGPHSPTGKGISVSQIESQIKLKVKEKKDENQKTIGWEGEIGINSRLVTSDKSLIIDPIEGRVIGFQIGYNDNDDDSSTSTERETKLIWGKKDRTWGGEVQTDFSYEYPAQFENLAYCNVSPEAQVKLSYENSAALRN